MNNKFLLSATIAFLMIITFESCQHSAKGTKSTPESELPARGLCAHRGALVTHPENTIVAFQEAIKAGAHMIEMDVFLTKDQEMVIMHDSKVDRTTDGEGRISDFTLEEIKKLDAGSWKAPEFEGTRVPTFREAMSIMPRNIWLNIHVKGEDQLPVLVAELIAKENRLHQAFMACSSSAAVKAREAVPEILICNMERQESIWDYVNETVAIKADFIQLRGEITPEYPEYIRVLKDNGVRVNYFGTDSLEVIKTLFEYGVDFPLVNDIIHTIQTVSELDILPVKPEF